MDPEERVRMTIARCPFYSRTLPTYIVCEGLTDGGYTSVNFKNKQRRKAFQDRYCCDDWQACLLAQALEKKYE